MSRLLKGTVAGTLLLSVGVGVSADDQEGSPPAEAAVAAPVAGPGVIVYIDPKTGEMGAPPEDLVVDKGEPARSSNEEFVEVPMAGGGVMVDLKGRFGTHVVAEPDGKGGVQLRHGQPVNAEP